MSIAKLKHRTVRSHFSPCGFSMRWLLIYCLISFLSNQSFAQRLSLKQQLLIEKTMEPILKEEAGKHELMLGRGAFVQLGQDTLLSIHGLRYLFKITGDTAIRLDKSIFHGTSFWRYLYEYNGQIFTIGGYGQFMTNNNVESFNFDSKEWYLIKTFGEKPSYIKGCFLRVKDQLYLFGNTQSGNNIQPDITDPYFYQFDLPTLTWKRFRHVQNELKNFHTEIVLYTKDFSVAIDQINAILINNKTLEYLVVSREELGMNATYQNISIHENALLFSNDIHHLSSENLPGIDLISFWNKHKSKAIKFNLNPSLYEQYPKMALIFALFFLGLILICVFLLLKNRIKNKKPTPLIQRILEHNEKTLSTEELDQLLGINHMEVESRKAKRHRILAQIEVASPGLIKRIKDESDKRRFVYYVSKD